MEDIEKEELRRLSPEERLKRLKSLEKRRKKELEEADQLIKESFDEILKKEETHEIPEEERALEPPPEEFTLEEQVRSEEPKEISDEEEGIQYAVDRYNELKNVIEQGATSDDGYINVDRVYELMDSLEGVAGYHANDQRFMEIAQGSKRLIKELMGDYHAKQDYKPGD